MTRLEKQIAKILETSRLDAAWFNPRILVNSCEVESIRHTGIGGETELVLPANNNRVAVIFQMQVNNNDDIYIAPNGNPAIFPLSIITAPGGPAIWNAYTIPSIIGLTWYVWSVMNREMLITEVLRK